MLGFWGGKERCFWVNELEIDADKELQFFALAHFPKLVKIGLHNKDLLVLRGLTEVKENLFGRFCEYLIPKVSIDHTGDLVIGQKFAQMCALF